MYPSNERHTSLVSTCQCDDCERTECRYWQHGNNMFDGKRHFCGQYNGKRFKERKEQRDFVEEHYQAMKNRNRP